MSTHKHIDLICILLVIAILGGVMALFAAAVPFTEQEGVTKEYESGLFSTDKVHTLEITMDDWDSFLEGCEDEKYVMCDVTIDGEEVDSVGIRAKGNTSLSSVKAYGNNRYSFKIEFDHYQDGISYQGLDKLSLNNIIQDNTYMKDYLTYQMMNAFEVDAPLCSYVYITVNGEEWGLYLAVEGVEESFLERNYGDGSGELYKPDSMSMGGGKGAGGDFEMPDDFNSSSSSRPQASTETETVGESSTAFSDTKDGDSEQMAQEVTEQPEAPPALPDGSNPENVGDFDSNQIESPKGRGDFNPAEGGGSGGMGSDDVKLIYTDDDEESYSNIFDNAKTDITDKDKARLIQSLKTLNEGIDIESVVDVEEVMRYFVVHTFVCNDDSYTGMMVHNYYLYEENGVLSMIPWDYNLAFGGFQGGSDATSTVNSPIDSPVSGGSTEDRPMIAWIFNDETYTQQYHELYEAFITYLESDAFTAEFNRVKEMIAPYVEKDPTKFCTYEEFETGVETLEAFCRLRAESVWGQLNGTIPSTSDGQTTDASALVDASSLNLSDMGSMGNTMGGGEDTMGTSGRFGGGGFPQTESGGTQTNEGETDTGQAGARSQSGLQADQPPDGADSPWSGAAATGE